jgi:hypothetical protein
MRRSAIWFVPVSPRFAPCDRRASNYPASCYVMAITTIGRPGRRCTVAGWPGCGSNKLVHHLVLEDCIAAVEAATARRDRLEAHIKAALPDWSLAPVVHALQALGDGSGRGGDIDRGAW